MVNELQTRGRQSVSIGSCRLLHATQHQRVCALLGLAPAQPNLAFEGVDELCAETRREAPISDSVGIRQLVCRHVERAECNIDKWKSRCEVLVAPTLGRGVMPAVEDRSCNQIAEATQRPIQIGMHKSRMCGGEGTEKYQHIG